MDPLNRISTEIRDPEILSSLEIIIVNWNSGFYLRDCIESIARSNLSGLNLSRVVIVDNASMDGSVDAIADSTLPLSIIRNSVNRGFAAACNQGAEGSTSRYLLFLNPDTRLDAEALKKAVAFMDREKNGLVGIVGGQIRDEEGRIARTCGRFPCISSMLSKVIGLDRIIPHLLTNHYMVEWDHNRNREVDHVMGAFFFVRRFLFEMLGGFDEKFFLYYEDLDFSLRVKNAGYKSQFLVDVCLFHEGGGCSDQIIGKRWFYSARSRTQYAFKHFSSIGAIVVLFATSLVEPVSRFVLALSRFSKREIGEIPKGFLMYWKWVFSGFPHQRARE